MTDLSQLVSEDSRKPIRRLTRVQLRQYADAHGLSYPQLAPKTALIALLEANDIDVTRPIGDIQWKVVQGKGPDGNPTQEMYPVRPAHASARKGVNSEAILSQRVAEKSKEEQAFEQKRMEALEKNNQQLAQENAKLKEMLETRLSALEQQQPRKQESEPLENWKKRDYWGTYRKAKAMGIEVHRKMKLDEIEKLIEEHGEHDATDGRQ